MVVRKGSYCLGIRTIHPETYSFVVFLSFSRYRLWVWRSMFNSWQRWSILCTETWKLAFAAHLASSNGFWVLHLEKQDSRRRPLPSICTWFRESVDLYLHSSFLLYCSVFLCSCFIFICKCPQICDWLRIGLFWDRMLPHWVIRTLSCTTSLQRGA
jgi:hypothetical protein